VALLNATNKNRTLFAGQASTLALARFSFHCRATISREGHPHEEACRRSHRHGRAGAVRVRRRRARPLGHDARADQRLHVRPAGRLLRLRPRHRRDGLRHRPGLGLPCEPGGLLRRFPRQAHEHEGDVLLLDRAGDRRGHRCGNSLRHPLWPHRLREPAGVGPGLQRLGRGLWRTVQPARRLRVRSSCSWW
jgi:hypothetical protein